MSGTVITVLSGKGGTGKTTVATNLAAVLSDRGAATVCLVDLDLALGDVAGALGLVPHASVRSAISGDGHLDLGALPALLTTYVDGIDCFLAPAGPGEAEKIPAHVVEELLSALRSRYDYVVVDTPGVLSSRVLAALDTSDHYLLLATPELPALQRVRLTMDMLNLISPRGAGVSLVLNRANVEGTLTDEIDGIVRAPIAARLPHSDAVTASINERKPLGLTDPHHPFVVAVRDFAKAHLGMPQGIEIIPPAATTRPGAVRPAKQPRENRPT